MNPRDIAGERKKKKKKKIQIGGELFRWAQEFVPPHILVTLNETYKSLEFWAFVVAFSLTKSLEHQLISSITQTSLFGTEML